MQKTFIAHNIAEVTWGNSTGRWAGLEDPYGFIHMSGTLAVMTGRLGSAGVI